MCHFINELEISKELKYNIKIIQILSVNALFEDKKQEEFLGVVKMESAHISGYERNLMKIQLMMLKIEKITKKYETNKIFLKMK